jgi:hypothetical protein
MRKIDNTFNAPNYIGVTKMSSAYPFPTMTNITVISGDVSMPSEETVMALRKAAKK